MTYTSEFARKIVMPGLDPGISGESTPAPLGVNALDLAPAPACHVIVTHPIDRGG
jgi:hypothetical protein